MGDEHPDTALSLNNLAGLYRVQGKYKQAELLFQCALAIREQQLGPDHPDTASSQWWLASLAHEQGKYAKAKVLYEQALRVFEQQLGADHPNTHALREQYQRLLRDM